MTLLVTFSESTARGGNKMAEPPRNNNNSAMVEPGRIRVEDKVYTADKLAEIHPGGPLFIQVSNWKPSFRISLL